MQRILQTLSLSFSDYTLQPLQTSFFFHTETLQAYAFFFFQTETLLPTRSAAANGGTTLVPPIQMATYEWQHVSQLVPPIRMAIPAQSAFVPLLAMAVHMDIADGSGDTCLPPVRMAEST